MVIMTATQQKTQRTRWVAPILEHRQRRCEIDKFVVKAQLTVTKLNYCN